MKKVLILTLVVVGLAAVVYGEMEGKKGIGPANLILQNCVLHNGSDNDIVQYEGYGVTPVLMFKSRDEGWKENVRFFTSYIASSPGEHHQRITMVNTKGTVVAEVNRGFRVEKMEKVVPDIFMGAVEEVMTIPALDGKDMSLFGVWTISVYADKTLVAQYPFPVVFQPPEE